MLQGQSEVSARAAREKGCEGQFQAGMGLDTAGEVDYHRKTSIMHAALRDLL